MGLIPRGATRTTVQLLQLLDSSASRCRWKTSLKRCFSEVDGSLLGNVPGSPGRLKFRLLLWCIKEKAFIYFCRPFLVNATAKRTKNRLHKRAVSPLKSVFMCIYMSLRVNPKHWLILNWQLKSAWLVTYGQREGQLYSILSPPHSHPWTWAHILFWFLKSLWPNILQLIDEGYPEN